MLAFFLFIPMDVQEKKTKKEASVLIYLRFIT
jgi:hypothetical protein